MNTQEITKAFEDAELFAPVTVNVAGFKITIDQDPFLDNPHEHDCGIPPFMISGGRRDFSVFDRHDTIEHPLSYRLPKYDGRKGWVKNNLSDIESIVSGDSWDFYSHLIDHVGHCYSEDIETKDSEFWRKRLSNKYSDGELSDAVENYVAEFHKEPRESSYRCGQEYLEVICHLWNLRGVPCELFAVTGYCQGDSWLVLMVYTPAFLKEVGIKSYDTVTKKDIEGCKKTISDWILGNIHAYTIKNRDGEHVGSCCGFYGDIDVKGMMFTDYLIPELEALIKENMMHLWWEDRDSKDGVSLMMQVNNSPPIIVGYVEQGETPQWWMGWRGEGLAPEGTGHPYYPLNGEKMFDDCLKTREALLESIKGTLNSVVVIGKPIKEEETD